MKIVRIVLTGGPAGGKTMALPLLAKHLSSNGRVLCIPEMATFVLSSNGFHFTELSEQAKNLFQEKLLKAYLEIESIYRIVAEDIYDSNNGPMIVILSDRAAIDISICNLNSSALTITSFDRYETSYNLVLHMDSCALDYPTIYEQCKRNNPARNETIQEAIQLNEKGFEAWKPDVRIHSEATWEAKLETLFKAVDAWLIKLYNK